MSITLAQIFGGIFGLAVAWLIHYAFVMYDKELAKREEQELIEYKEKLRKSVK